MKMPSPFPRRNLLLGLVLGLVLSSCQTDPAASSEASALNENQVTGDSSTIEEDTSSTYAEADTSVLESDSGGYEDGLRMASTNDSGPPVPKPDDIDPTRIFEDPLEETKNPGTKETPAKYNQGGLEGCWTDSREENRKNPGFKIFRPCEFKKFPPSRFRFRMDLQAGGTCSWLWLAPNDGHRMKPGTWNYDQRSKVLTIKDEDGEVVRRYDVVEVDRAMLKVKAE